MIISIGLGITLDVAEKRQKINHPEGLADPITHLCWLEGWAVLDPTKWRSTLAPGSLIAIKTNDLVAMFRVGTGGKVRSEGPYMLGPACTISGVTTGDAKAVTGMTPVTSLGETS